MASALVLVCLGCNPDAPRAPAEQLDGSVVASNPPMTTTQLGAAATQSLDLPDRPGAAEVQTLRADGLVAPQSEIESTGGDLPDWIPFARESVDLLPLTDGRVSRLEWSPRGNRLAMSGWDVGRGWGSFVVNADGARLIEVDGYFGSVVSWSPDGSKILHETEQRLTEHDSRYSQARPVVGPSVVDVDTLERFHLDDSGGTYTRFIWSPDSTKVVYFQVPYGLLADRFAVWVANASGTQRRLIDTYSIKHDSPLGSVWWSPDSSEFVFTVNTRADHQELWRARAGASHASFLANGRNITAGYSPDSARIWASVENYDNTHSLLLFDSLFVANAAPYRSYEWTGLASAITPTWSRAGKHMSFIATEADGTSRLFVDYPSDPWGEPFASGEEIWAAESPDGTQIAYTVAASDGEYELRVVNADRSDVRRIVSGAEIAARWSPDGSRIWYSTVSAGTGVEIGIALADGSSTLPLHEADKSEATWSARWSPDGSRISYASDENGDSLPEQLWVAEADGSRSRLAADVRGHRDARGERIQGITARWSADGSHVWYLLHASGRHESSDTAFPGVELWAVPVADGEPRLVAAGELIQWHWSPDARYVAYELIEQESPFSGGVWIAATNDPP